MKHFKYGSFISYRNREVNSNYFINLVSFLNAPICEATDLDVFFDRKYVEPSDSIPDRIYEGIAKSMLFIPIFEHHYINLDHRWCAKELIYAIKIEKAILEKMELEDRKEFKFILPLLYCGKHTALPKYLKERLPVELINYEYAIKNNLIARTQMIELGQQLRNLIHKHSSIFRRYIDDNEELRVLLANIKRPTDKEVDKWIRDYILNLIEFERGKRPKF